MKKLDRSFLIFYSIIPIYLFNGADACWGKDAPQYADMTADYSLAVGSDLLINCYLKTDNVTVFNKRLTSSDLIIEKQNTELSKFTRVIDDRTIQLKIPKATVNDTGMYICKVRLSHDSKFIVCGTLVSVGYPPHPIKSFSCINKNFEKLYCTWSTEKNDVYTRYTIVTYFLNNPNLIMPCPTHSMKPNSCEWSGDSDPKFLPFSRNFSFTIRGSNSLGIIVQNFTVDLHSVVIPSSPKNLEITNILQTSATINWKSPINFFTNFPLIYQIRISLQESSIVREYNIENSTNFQLENLIPDTTYQVSLRCRSFYSENDDEWSKFTSLTFKTLTDVRYEAENIMPEANSLPILERTGSPTFWKEMLQRVRLHLGVKKNVHDAPKSSRNEQDVKEI